ncbi:hypothetical protein ACWEO2_23020 [Nocardia sp. NPDC004278]
MSTSELWSTRTTAPAVCTTQGAVDPVQIRGLREIDRGHHVGAPARVRCTGPQCLDRPMLAQANVAFRGAAVRIQVRIGLPGAEAARS